MPSDGPPSPLPPPPAPAARPARVGPLARAVSAALLGLVLIAFGGSAHAAPFDTNDTTWQGCSEMLDALRVELGAARVLPIGVIDWEQVQPEDGILAIHPEHVIDVGQASAFMKAGGRIAIVDDYGRGDETLRAFKIERVPAPARPVSALRNKASFAIAEPVIEIIAGRSTGPHPVVADVPRLAMNHPTALRHPNLSAVLRVPAVGEPDAIVAVAGQVGLGRLFAMSDPSALINLMLRYPANRAFAAGLGRYLVTDESGQRKGRLFVVANRFRESGSYGDTGTLGQELEDELRSLAASLTEARRDGFPRWLLLTLAVAGAFAMGSWVARSAGKPYKGPVPRHARPVPLVAQGGVAGRFALLAAPSSSPALAMLELRSALFEAATHKLALESEPSAEVLARLLQREAALDGEAYSALKEVLATMQKVEAAVVSGRSIRVRRPALAYAAAVVEQVLDACHARAPGPPAERPPGEGPPAPGTAAGADGRPEARSNGGGASLT